MEKWSVRYLFGALGLLAIGAWLNSIATLGFTRSPAHWALVLGLLCLLLGALWPAIAARMSEKATAAAAAVATDLRVWIGIVFLLVILSTAWSFLLATQRNQLATVVNTSIRPSIAALERYVIPREMNPDQIRAAGELLSTRAAVPVTIRVNPFDREAREFATSISTALGVGGWETGQPEVVRDMQDGLTLRCKQVSDAVANITRPVELLGQALTRGGVQIDSTATETGPPVPRDECFIEIGARRRDIQALPIPLRFKVIEGTSAK
jgi:hypothetical protein